MSDLFLSLSREAYWNYTETFLSDARFEESQIWLEMCLDLVKQSPRAHDTDRTRERCSFERNKVIYRGNNREKNKDIVLVILAQVSTRPQRDSPMSSFTCRFFDEREIVLSL